MRDRLGAGSCVVIITPYILIGGTSSRFGRDKATFEFESETLAARAVRICEEAFPESRARFVSKASGKFLNREMIADVYPNRSAAGAIHAALAEVSTPWIFVLACDLPLVTSQLLRKLSGRIDGDHGCIVPVQPDGRWQPLCAFYRADMCLRIFETAISGDGQHPSLRSIAEAGQPRIVDFAEYSDLPDAYRLLTNVNTMGDLECI
jgi:molybdopterin-guanine dinucleotide biosynthesis protein A